MKNRLTFVLVAIVCIGTHTFANSSEDLINACRQGDLAGVQAALDAGADVNATDASGNTAIGNAYFWPEVTKLLLEKGADPNGGNYPALITASNVYSTEVVKLLIDAGADPNKPGLIDQSGFYKDLIEKEKAKGKKKANKALIKAYEAAIANAVPTKMYAVTALCMQTNHVPGLKMMIDAGMKLELEDGSNALHILANYAMSKEERKSLYSKSEAAFTNAGVKVPDWYLNLPDDRNGKSTEMAELLINAGCDLNTQDATGFTPLCQVLKGAILSAEPTTTAKIDVGKMFIEKGADVNGSSTMTGSNWTYYPICLATELADMELIKMLVEKGANIDVQVQSSTITLFSNFASIMGNGGSGYTATIIGILKGHDEIVKYLVEQGADLTIGVEGFATLESGKEGLKCLTTVKNKSPIYFAVEKSDMAVIDLIAANLMDIRLPEYQVRQWADRGSANANTDDWVYHCVKIKKLKYSPSEHAALVGNTDAAQKLAAIKL
jgi:ankyrin repeat protein